MDTRLQLKQIRDTILAERKAEITLATDEANRRMNGILSKYQKKLDALGILLEDEPESNNGKEQVFEETVIRPDAAAKNLFAAVWEAIEANRAPTFSSKTLIPYIREKYPKMADSAGKLSNPLWRLAKSKQIEVKYKGSGRQPSIYRLPQKVLDAPTKGDASLG